MIADQEQLIEVIVGRYDGDEGMLIPMMQDIQAECGYLPLDQLRRLARRLQVPLSRLYAVATFYSSFRLAPKGLHEVTLCVGTVCYLKGAGAISERICKEFQVAAGGTTPDGLFSYQPVNCVGACALAPVMIVDGEYHGGLTSETAMKILRGLPAEAQPDKTGAKP
ncbi:MAG TPA: NAD(P)H-dependent oxidoreductase subunit E [Phycisphaerae bacterium]|nr:NAD(P)H-dependent oxidoreductase subunit E [Phycisphaerae bacterium]